MFITLDKTMSVDYYGRYSLIRAVVGMKSFRTRQSRHYLAPHFAQLTNDGCPATRSRPTTTDRLFDRRNRVAGHIRSAIIGRNAAFYLPRHHGNAWKCTAVVAIDRLCRATRSRPTAPDCQSVVVDRGSVAGHPPQCVAREKTQ